MRPAKSRGDYASVRIIAIAALRRALVYHDIRSHLDLNAPDVVTLDVRPVDPQDMFAAITWVFG